MRYLVFLLLFVVSGCASTPDALMQTKVINVGGLEVVSRNSEVELMVFKTPEDLERFCLAPPPDAVTTFGESVGLSGSEKTLGSGLSEGVSLSEGEGALSLGGRGETVLIARELMYRACELSLNINANPKLALQIYRETLHAIESITQTTIGVGVNPLAAVAADVRPTSLNQNDEDWDDDGDDEDENKDEE